MGRDDPLDRGRESRRREAERELSVRGPFGRGRTHHGTHALHRIAAGAAEGLPGTRPRARAGLVGGAAGIEGPAVVALAACAHGAHDKGPQAHYVS